MTQSKYKSWHYLHKQTAAVRILPESPRWLLAMGRKDEVMLILKEAARVNKRQLPANTDKILQQSCQVASAIYGFRDPSLFVGAEGYFGLLWSHTMPFTLPPTIAQNRF
ncbi:unnamed protein product [Timema podura]|uniref:Uncharacterized protein n=1 Tax=Timema podura TaxID=61482 RepID=A0ABN7NWD3_TIMPD|nr:unnamed protein product [Timema podura]